MVQVPKTKGFVTGDWLIYEETPEYNRESVLIDNSGSGAVELDLASGYPMHDATPLLAAAINTCNGLLMVHTVIPAGEKRLVAVFARGPAVINRDALPTEDHAGTAFVMATWQTALQAISPKMIVRREPLTTFTQET